MLLTNWICFCLQGFLAEKTRRSHSYLAHEAGKILVQGVKPVLSWSNHVFKYLCTVFPTTNQEQISENWLRILYPCLTSVTRPENEIICSLHLLYWERVSKTVFYPKQYNTNINKILSLFLATLPLLFPMFCTPVGRSGTSYSTKLFRLLIYVGESYR